LDAWPHDLDHRPRRTGQKKRDLASAAALALEQSFRDEAADDDADGRTIQSHSAAERGLIETRRELDRKQRGVLRGRQIVGPGLLDEDRVRDLVQPPDQMARLLENLELAVVWSRRGGAGVAAAHRHNVRRAPLRHKRDFATSG
jgi:hypothetical protein